MSTATFESAARSPLTTPAFRALWIATIVSNIGTWMNDVGSAWLMTSLSPSPLWVAMVQTATTLPIFLFALPAGALADVIDRRKLLIGSQLLILVGAAALATSTWLGLTTLLLLLGLTAVMGLGAALSAPAFQAIVPELVDRPVLAEAISLNSLGVNIARAIGPALGGVIVALSGPPAVYALNAVSILAVLGVLVMWRRQVEVSSLPAEHFFGSLRPGFRYARHSPAVPLLPLRPAASSWPCLGRLPSTLLTPSLSWPSLASSSCGGDRSRSAPCLQSIFSAPCAPAFATHAMRLRCSSSSSARSLSSSSRALFGRFFLWSDVESLGWMRPGTARCWAVWEQAP